MAAGPGEHIFARHFLRLDALEVAAGPGENIFARHILRSDALEVAAGPVNTFLRVTFCAWTRWKWPLAPANTFLRVTFCARLRIITRGPRFPGSGNSRRLNAGWVRDTGEGFLLKDQREESL